MAARSAASASGLRSVAVAGDVTNSVIITGDNATVQVRVDGQDALLARLLSPAQRPRKVARPTPLDDRPPSSRDHLDREVESGALLEATQRGRPVELYGEADVGKTFVLTHALGSDAARALRDGVVYVFAKGKPYADLLQDLFVAFYDCEPASVAPERQILLDLRDRQALIVLDAVELPRDELQQLVLALPGSRFVIATRERLLWEGASLEVLGLRGEDALELVEQELRRGLTNAERAQVLGLCESLGGHPLRIRQAVAQVRAGRSSWGELERELGSGPADPPLGRLLLAGLSEEQAAVVAYLAALHGEYVGAEHLAGALDRTGIEPALGELEALRCIASGSPRYRVAGALGALAEGRSGMWPGTLEAETSRLLEYFSRWGEAHRGEPARTLREAPALLELMRVASTGGRHAEAIRLGRAIDAAFAWGRRWANWGAILRAVLAAARATGDAAAEGWALHQLGTRAFGLGDTGGAVETLEDALEIRERIGDREGAAATRHNLEFILGPPPGGEPPEDAGSGPPGGGMRRLLVAGLAGAAILAAVVAVAVGSGDPSGEPSSGTAALTEEEMSPERTATPVARLFRLSVETSGEGGVTSLPEGIACGEICSRSFEPGTDVSLRAREARGWSFKGWSSPCSGDGGCSVRMDRDRVVRATFVAEPGTSECQDGKDNDADDAIDDRDPGCSDGTEAPAGRRPPAGDCRDGDDNDGDRLVDREDPGCSDGTEEPRDPAPTVDECSDTEDNDEDGLTDGDDPGCENGTEAGDAGPKSLPECSDSEDNDGDSLKDDNDPGCLDDGTEEPIQDFSDPVAPTPTPDGF